MKEGETICPYCNGEGCISCKNSGIVTEESLKEPEEEI